MEHHIDRRIVLNQDSEFNSLYEWCLQEFDIDGNKLGRDQIPWNWSLCFIARELVLSDTLAIEADYLRDDSEGEKIAVRERQVIRAKLQPNDRVNHGGYRETRYSMFGTSRAISNFELYIQKLEGDEERENCTAWGSVSYTAEMDFYDETTDDCVIFYLHVSPETFSRYLEKVATAAVDEVTFRIGRVSGFYSDWSPSISTSNIKVLTNTEEHKLEHAGNCDVIPPRLGEVKCAELDFCCVNKLTNMKLDALEKAEVCRSDQEPSEWPDSSADQSQSNQRILIANNRQLSLLSSLRIAAWIIAGILFLMLIT